jgi:hypothetical protein
VAQVTRSGRRSDATKGWLTLTGDVEWRDERSSAQKVLQALPGLTWLKGIP